MEIAFVISPNQTCKSHQRISQGPWGMSNFKLVSWRQRNFLASGEKFCLHSGRPWESWPAPSGPGANKSLLARLYAGSSPPPNQLTNSWGQKVALWKGWPAEDGLHTFGFTIAIWAHNRQHLWVLTPPPKGSVSHSNKPGISLNLSVTPGMEGHHSSHLGGMPQKQ